MSARRRPDGKGQGQGGGASQRQLRVGEAMRHELAAVVARGELRDPVLAEAQLTVTEVRAARDLRSATAFVVELGGELRPEVRDALERAAPWLGGHLARALHLKYAPRLRFAPDTSFAEAARIEAVLASARRGGGGGGDGGAGDGDDGDGAAG
ncbi:MAG TPA: 30S ribosome-binding factor RbfA [Geminicoccaceae bacterium]|nr:30S ribosome-binding factor RbfA [Geminicoccaceae bacterium]